MGIDTLTPIRLEMWNGRCEKRRWQKALPEGEYEFGFGSLSTYERRKVIADATERIQIANRAADIFLARLAPLHRA